MFTWWCSCDGAGVASGARGHPTRPPPTTAPALFLTCQRPPFPRNLFVYSARWSVTWWCRCVKGNTCSNMSLYFYPSHTLPSASSSHLWLSFPLACVSFLFLPSPYSALYIFIRIPFHDRIEGDMYRSQDVKISTWYGRQ